MSDVPSGPAPGAEVTPEGLAQLQEVVRERTLDVFATFFAAGWQQRTLRLASTSPATLATEIADAVSVGVLRHLDTDPTWTTTPSRPARAVEAIFDAVDVDRWGGALWYQPASAIRRLDYEATKTPGWPYMWVYRRLAALGALVSSRTQRLTPVAADNLVSVTIRRDGSATALFGDGTSTEIGPVGPDDRLPENVLRQSTIDSHEGQYLTVEQLRDVIAESNHDNGKEDGQ